MSDLHQRAEDIAARLEEHDPETCPSQDETSEVIYALLAALEVAEKRARDAVSGLAASMERRHFLEARLEVEDRLEARRDADGREALTAVQGETGAASGFSPRPGDSQ